MKRNVLSPFVFVALLVLVVGLACGFDFGTKTPEPAPQPIIQPTQPGPVQLPTQQPVQQPTLIPPTAPPPPQSNQFFTEEFDNGQTNWSVNYMPADATISTHPIGNVKVNFEKGYLQFNITDNWIGAFAVYDPFEYTDVRIDAHVANYGRVTNDFALVCRYSEKGFYEFNIKNDGYYFFNYIQIGGDGKVHIKQIYLGATTLVNRDANDYGLLCQGSTFTMYVNGENIQEAKDSSLYSGKIGVEGFSLQVVPVDLHVEWVKISQP
jgi:hypothetical protein